MRSRLMSWLLFWCSTSCEESRYSRERHPEHGRQEPYGCSKASLLKPFHPRGRRGGYDGGLNEIDKPRDDKVTGGPAAQHVKKQQSPRCYGEQRGHHLNYTTHNNTHVTSQSLSLFRTVFGCLVPRLSGFGGLDGQRCNRRLPVLGPHNDPHVLA